MLKNNGVEIKPESLYSTVLVLMNYILMKILSIHHIQMYKFSAQCKTTEEKENILHDLYTIQATITLLLYCIVFIEVLFVLICRRLWSFSYFVALLSPTASTSIILRLYAFFTNFFRNLKRKRNFSEYFAVLKTGLIEEYKSTRIIQY